MNRFLVLIGWRRAPEAQQAELTRPLQLLQIVAFVVICAVLWKLL